jgi:glycerate dehydrogenase
VTPHMAWATKEARLRLMDVTVRNIASFLDGKPENVITS